MATVILQKDLIESVADALQFISYYHPIDFIEALNSAYEKEANPAARDAVNYAQKLQRKLVESNLPDESTRRSFLQTAYSLQLQDIADTLSQPVSSVD